MQDFGEIIQKTSFFVQYLACFLCISYTDFRNFHASKLSLYCFYTNLFVVRISRNCLWLVPQILLLFAFYQK